MLKYYIAIARPDHWFKNIFMLPGIILAFNYLEEPFTMDTAIYILFAVLSTCLMASSNYVINEWLDAEFDKVHPVKKNRPSVVQDLKAKWVYTEYVLLALSGLSIAYFISRPFFFGSILFLVMGFLYNVQPFRTKNRVYLDVISESINNPIRLSLGWFILIHSHMPPSSILISYWMGGAFLMGAKRFAEYRFINSVEIAGLYRASFKKYTEQKLLTSTVFYALVSCFFLGAFLIKHKIELLISFPFFAILFTWYLNIAHEENSIVQRPEKLFRKKSFILYVLFLSLLVIFLLQTDIEAMDYFLKTS
jgi:4-hydroxybenzoate polyprenyltransferase